MMNPNLVLLDGTLKRTFYFYLTTVNSRGEEKETIYKKKKKDFLNEVQNCTARVVLVDTYPKREEWELGIMYLLKSGKGIYYKDKEGIVPWQTE